MDGFSCSRVGWPRSKAFQQSIFFEFVLFLLHVGRQDVCPCEEWEARLHVWSFLWPPVVSGGFGCETCKNMSKTTRKPSKISAKPFKILVWSVILAVILELWVAPNISFYFWPCKNIKNFKNMYKIILRCRKSTKT